MGNCAISATDATVCAPTPTDDALLTPLIDGLVSYELYADDQGFAEW